VITYRHALGWMVRSLPDADFAQITSPQIDAAWSAIADADELGPNTLRLYRVIMASWLDWSIRKAGLARHALREIPLPKKVAPFRPKVSIQRLYALRAACVRLNSDYERVRALALLETLWSTLTRRAEVRSLQVRHLRLEDDPPEIHIECGKGGWSGNIPISDRAAGALRDWLAVRGDAGHDWLWCNEGEKRQRMGMHALYKLLGTLATSAGIAVDECKPHAVRRGSSTAMLQAGQDLGTVSLYLRHRSIQTTMDYVESSTNRLAKVRNWMEDVEKAEAKEGSRDTIIEEIRGYMAAAQEPTVPAEQRPQAKSDPRAHRRRMQTTVRHRQQPE